MLRRVIASIVVFGLAVSVPVFAANAEHCTMLHPQCSRMVDMPCCQNRTSDQSDRTAPAARFMAPVPDVAPMAVPALAALPVANATMVPTRFEPPHGYASGDLLTRLSILLI
jgi:hypothetical protein